MEGCVQVISREMIKPSSQTLLHPKELKLSYLDKLLSHLYVPLIFFYEADESRGLTTSNHLQISQKLKHSLLHILPSFYPLAGRLKNNISSIDCNDAGVEFVDARIRAPLRDSISKDDRLNQYLPSYCTAFDRGNQPRPILVVQITFFDCGGLVVAAGFSHVIVDMSSAVSFLHAWAASFRGEFEQKTAPHTFGTADYFPTLGFLPPSRFQKYFTSKENFMTKRFVFSKEKIDILREAATSLSESGIKDPSRVELISAFIWKHFMAARLQNKQNPKKIYAAFHAVNIRPRIIPPRLLENVFGNCGMIAIAYAACHASPDELRLHELIGRLRSRIRRVRGSYITKLMNKESFVKDLLKMAFLVTIGKLELCHFTSWRGFSMYELDFGWRKPVWFSTPSLPAKNFTILLDSKSGDDVEAIVTMMPDDLQILDAQINLISTNDRSILVD